MGEIIPNNEKYGDYKDYSAVIYSMARGLDIPLNLALCYRGRGVELNTGIPVSQFNHMFVYYHKDTNDYWYDGTNRTGVGGLTTVDLVNSEAIILEHGNSRIIKIKESPQNLMDINGVMQIEGSSLQGTICINLVSQYAIDLSYLSIFLNNMKMKEAITEWIREYLNDRIQIIILYGNRNLVDM